MVDYRVYFISQNNHIFAVETIEAANDRTAIARAQRLGSEQPSCRAVEVWERGRQVHRHLLDAAD